jgi:hypothetical protein
MLAPTEGSVIAMDRPSRIWIRVATRKTWIFVSPSSLTLIVSRRSRHSQRPIGDFLTPCERVERSYAVKHRLRILSRKRAPGSKLKGFASHVLPNSHSWKQSTEKFGLSI